MRNWTRSLLFLMATQLFSQTADVQFEEKRDEADMDALRRWIRDKRMVTLKEIGGDLSLSGEVRTEFQNTSEIRDGIRQRGSNSTTNRPAQAWDVEVNLMLDYRTDRTWAAIKLEFDNDMGIRRGTVNRIRLEKAYLGGRLVPGDTFTLDGEIGRRNLINVFDSRIEFGALFDGVLFRLNKAFDSVGDFYTNTGAFIIDDKQNHYGYVTEMGLLRIANVGLNAKYSIIDWRKHYPNPVKNDRYRFVVGQALLSYQAAPAWTGKRLILLYGAYLRNYIAEPVPQTANLVQNNAYYIGCSIGQVRKAGDFAVDGNWQYVQAQAIPDYDASGIGRGNAQGAGLYTVNIDGSGGMQSSANAVGSGNYKGFELEGLYAFTSNLTILQNYKQSWTLNHQIGPTLTYRQYEVEFIYAF
jgi:hypothetical protein